MLFHANGLNRDPQAAAGGGASAAGTQAPAAGAPTNGAAAPEMARFAEENKQLRETVANLYNHWFRRGKKPYRAENVCICAGGRLALSRAIAALGDVRVGHFLPDYTAYEDLLGAFGPFTPVSIPLDETMSIAPAALRDRGLQALLISNPCNPTGRVIRDAELAEWLTLDATLLFDEFYSHFIWSGRAPVSVAEFVEDPDRDPVLIFDGLTKSYRYPGWRVGWVVGPRDMIEQITCAGSFLDGGGPRWVQRAAIEILQPDRAEAETAAMRAAFRPKRDLTVGRLRAMGVAMPREPEGTFYAWGRVPGGDGMAFFREALKHKVIVVPGEFFDVNPRKARPGPSPYKPFVRFSFGAPIANVRQGLDRLSEMLR